MCIEVALINLGVLKKRGVIKLGGDLWRAQGELEEEVEGGCE